ncbi:hypothetical protein Tco_0649668 [Tanacetum coccineum]
MLIQEVIDLILLKAISSWSGCQRTDVVDSCSKTSVHQAYLKRLGLPLSTRVNTALVQEYCVGGKLSTDESLLVVQ